MTASLNTYDQNRNPDWEEKLTSLDQAEKFGGNSATRHGHRSEAAALEMYRALAVTEESHHLLRCGLIVPPSCPWLGSYSDGILMKDGWPVELVDVKSPFCGEKLSAHEIL